MNTTPDQWSRIKLPNSMVAEGRKPSSFAAPDGLRRSAKTGSYFEIAPETSRNFLLRRSKIFLSLLLVSYFAIGPESLFADGKSIGSSREQSMSTVSASDPLVVLASSLQGKLVKIYGAGGPKGLESYQSGFLVSEAGHVVTSWSTVLDVNAIRVVTLDGRKDDAEMVGMDPETEIAVLKMKQGGSDFFNLKELDEPVVGNRVFGLSNLFGIATGDEAVSIQRGVIMALSPLSARRGRLKTLYQGRVLVLDVMTNNPGATGGAVVNLKGNLVGMLGKELRDEQTNIWLNYAIPADVVSSSVRRILEGKTNMNPRSQELVIAKRPHRLSGLGVVLIPDVLAKTPAFVDQVIPKSIAERSGLSANDLVLMLNDRRIDSRRSLEESLASIDRADSFTLLVQRGQELVRLDVRP